MWLYDGPKTSYGSNPGFEVKSDDLKAKVKFAETTSEPFTARVFAALGYHVEPIGHVECLKIEYDRRIFREFHLRKEIQMHCMIFGFVPVYTNMWEKRMEALQSHLGFPDNFSSHMQQEIVRFRADSSPPGYRALADC